VSDDYFLFYTNLKPLPMKKGLCFLVFSFFVLHSLTAQDLISSVDSKDHRKAEALLRSGASATSIDSKGRFPLWLATWNGDTAMVGLLLLHGADANQAFKNEKGASISCLDVACQNGLTEIAVLLIDHGAKVDLKGAFGHSPLRIASRNGNLDIVKILIGKGARIDTEGEDLATPLESAAGKGHLDIVKVLIEAGAKVNHQDKDGDTPLHEAARGGYLEVAQYLLSKGADTSIKDSDGSTAGDIARSSGQPKVAELLKDHR
jgi:ankyrin repeat protein